MPRFSASSIKSAAEHFCPPLNPILCTTKQARIRLTRFACNIDFMDSANAKSQLKLTLRYDKSLESWVKSYYQNLQRSGK
ncbi:hypothetical protein [Helicobacter cinaedi]|uniref:hypothetical protein n=1 Tax=Helicobacter cinaedi TaxID=213 RepID=UPI0011C070F6|nr:hypothetical protein [Helicobacter cinaedi]